MLPKQPPLGHAPLADLSIEALVVTTQIEEVPRKMNLQLEEQVEGQQRAVHLLELTIAFAVHHIA